MLEQSPQDKEAALKVTIFASISLAIMGVDYLWLLRDEVRYIWPRLRWAWTPWLYVFTRYLGLSGQIFNVYFTVRMYHGILTPATGCHFWFVFQALNVQFLLASVEGLLMHRIYALFLRNRVVLFILILFIVGQMASMWISAKLSFPTNEYTSTCLMVRSNPGGAFFSATTMTTNVAIFFMTFWRYLRLPAKWTNQRLGRVVLRDSALTLSAISLMMLFLTLCSLDVIKPHTSGNATYYWLVGILWISAGRIIVNHEMVRRDSRGQFDGDTWKGELEITSQMEMGENTLTEEIRLGQFTLESTTDRSPSSSGTQLSPLPSPTIPSISDGGQKWLGDYPSLNTPRQLRRLGKKPVLSVDIPTTRESELSPWSDCTNTMGWQWVESHVALVDWTLSADTCVSRVQVPCGDSQTRDITDAWKDELADDPGPLHLELPPSHVPP